MSKNRYNEKELWIPHNSNFRQFKFRLQNGKIIIIKDRVRNKKILRKWLIKLNPKDVYYSAGCFLQPTKLRGDKTKNRMLFKDLAFDIDSEEPHSLEDLENARVTTLKVIRKMCQSFNLSPNYILFTGGKGFQVVYYKSKLKSEDVKNILDLKEVDEQVTKDKYRVIRLPKTYHNSGRLSRFIDEKKLKNPIDEIIHSPYDYMDSPGKLFRANDKNNLSEVNGQVSESGQTEPVFSINITNEVKGTQRFIPILKYSNYKVAIKDIEKLAKKYGLNEWFIFKTKNYFIIISLASFDTRRLEKILNSSKSYSKYEFRKRRKIFFRTSAIKKGNKFSDKPYFMGRIEFNFSTKNFLISNPHINYLNYKGVEIFKENKIGHNEPIKILTKFE